MNMSMRQAVHDKMAAIAAEHAAGVYPGMETTAERLFALLADTALAYQMEVEADRSDAGPTRSLGAASGMDPAQQVITALAENLEMKADDPAAMPVDGYMAWRLAAGTDDAS